MDPQSTILYYPEIMLIKSTKQEQYPSANLFNPFMVRFLTKYCVWETHSRTQHSLYFHGRITLVYIAGYSDSDSLRLPTPLQVTSLQPSAKSNNVLAAWSWYTPKGVMKHWWNNDWQRNVEIPLLTWTAQGPGHETDHTPSPSAEVKMRVATSSLPQHVSMTWRVIKRWMCLHGMVLTLPLP
jgi:hypothetical protein